MSEREFRDFTKPMVGRGHANALNWLLKVAPSDRAAFEREIGAEISTLSPQRRLVRDTTPGMVFPIRYAAVGVKARSVIGFNAYTRVDRRRAIERAIASGRPTSTPLLHLASTNQPGLVLYAPVYKPGGRHLMEDVVGVVVGSFSMADAQVAVQRAVAPGTSVRVRLADSDVLRSGTVDVDAPKTTFTFRRPGLVGPEPGRVRRRAAARSGHAGRRRPAHRPAAAGRLDALEPPAAQHRPP